MEYTPITQIQRAIEETVTNGRGYDPKVNSRIPQDIQETEIGLQLTLLNMDLRDNKMAFETAYSYDQDIRKVIKRLNNAKAPLEAITSPEGIDAMVKQERLGYIPSALKGIEYLLGTKGNPIPLQSISLSGYGKQSKEPKYPSIFR